ncbi:YheC/YheD family endospore coat-associated protein [Paenibacillus apiarius]|uniref:YheC/YheD family protein n=1 Tax=Paenibacillus apiarius TaxID=46240 RepID=A0ABT4E509_9BACL|nr:YheC/YheD family protein [Paenibacillus apiarius]MBN3522935.1 YheC/YheD family protein [Paenibacillus apiarius]MCY9514920.1 YheC/YheD family protein [Paenibacillus apiarius]MCY9523336.1 YheC/YheD family protein [Paenibacillus apiarius]MCY9554164.1 YheC/YheD family protein [Paenibacillus apiarius]MCY9559426.1 YheC/YheD family protein [Paenibacillus apiarius]
MSLTVCNVHLTPNSEKILYVSNSLLKQLKLAGKKSVRLRLGKTSIPATVKPIKKPGKHLYVTAGLRSSFRVPKSGLVYLLNEHEGDLQLGPLIGVMSDTSSRSVTSPFGSRTGFIKQILRAGNKKAYVFAFSPRDINWQNDTVHAFFVTDSGAWVRKTVPLPDVVYNRLPSRRAETSTSINALRERFIKKKIPFFNWSFFNKSDVYALLKDESDANRYVPESIMNPTPDTIRAMLDRHQFVYYKPSAGSLGIGIYRLTYLPKKGYFARYTNNGKNVLLRFKQFSSLIRMLEARHGRSLRGYVVQQGVRLIEIDGCPIDFRFHMHKNGEDKWVVVGIGAKKAGRGSVTTHVKNGGRLMTPEQALQRAFGARAEEVLDNSKQVAIELAEAIERNHPHLLGELGFDLGIDRDEQVWMFEANAKPGRSIFKHPSLKSEGQSSIEHILEHCLYLSKFRRGEST